MRRPSRRTTIVAIVAIVALVAGALSAFVLVRRHQARDVRGSSTVEFVPTQLPTSPPPRPRRKARLSDLIAWPTYGYGAERLRVAPAVRLQPPFRAQWMLRARSLLEFPPAVAFGRLYLATNNGNFLAVNAKTGKVMWRHRTRRCAAASPAVAGRLVIEAFLNPLPCSSERGHLDGEVIAFDAPSGRIRWRFRLGPSESSPLVHGRVVYVADWRGKVYALDVRTGRPRWSFQTGDKVKGALAFAGNRLYVGSYDSHVYALDAGTGRKIWDASAQERLGPRGTFYSTPAVAYGRVYIGSTDGKVYSFGAASGKLRWSQRTGGYVYSSPAVWDRRVYIGSYDGHLYAFDAATGDERWRFRANGRISGSPTVLAGVVYFATLEGRTYALDARSGRRLWSFPDGKYSPVVADEKRLYLVGHTRVYGMVPR